MIKFHTQRGMTFPEILVVVAVAGAVGAIGYASLQSLHEKEKVIAVQETMKVVQVGAQDCMDRGVNLADPIVIGEPMCAGSDLPWLALGKVASGWKWTDAGYDPDISDGDYTVVATNGKTTMTCTKDGCTTS